MSPDNTARPKAQGRTLDFRVVEEIFLKIPVLAYETDADGAILEHNPAFEEMFEYTRKELRSLNIRDLYVNGRHRDLLIDELRAWDGRIYNFIVLVKTKRDRNFYLSVDCAMPDPTSTQGTVLGVARDVTTAVDLLGGFCQVSGSGRITFCNHALADLVGARSPLDVIERDAAAIFGSEFLSSVRALRNERDTRAAGVHEGDIQRLDGRIASLRIRWRREERPDRKDIHRLELAVEDITDLRESQKEREVLIDQALDGAYLLEDDKFVMVNKRMVEIFGHSREELIGMRWHELVDQRDHKRVANAIKAKLEGKKLPPYAVRGRRADGQGISIVLSSLGVRGTSRSRLIGYVRDTTLMEAKERELEALAEQKSLAVIEPIQHLAHELQGPVAGLQGTIQMILHRRKRRDLEEHELLRRLEEMDRMCKHFRLLVTQALRVLIADGGGNEGEEHRTAVRASLFDVVHLVTPLARDRGFNPAQMYVGCPEHLPVLEMIEDDFLEVVFNLLTNAIKYAHDDPDRFRIDLTADVTPDDLLLTVDDWGIGVPPGEEEVIFGKFEKSSRAKGYPGVGLGLFVTRTIVTSQGGEVWLENNQKPTRFCVRLPWTGLE